MWWRCVWWPALAGPRRMHDVKRQVTAELRPKSEIPRSKIGGKTGSKEKQLQIHQYTSCTFTKISKMVSWMGCNLRILYILLGKHLASKSCVYVCCFLLDAFEAQMWSQTWCGYDRLASLLMLQHSVLAIFRCNTSTCCSRFWKISGVPWSGKKWMQVANMDKIWDKRKELVPSSGICPGMISKLLTSQNYPLFHYHWSGKNTVKETDIALSHVPLSWLWDEEQWPPTPKKLHPDGAWRI